MEIEDGGQMEEGLIKKIKDRKEKIGNRKWERVLSSLHPSVLSVVEGLTSHSQL